MNLRIFSTSLLFQAVSVGRRRFSAEFQLVFRLIKGLIFIAFVSVLIILIAIAHMTVQDILVCFLAFMPTGWSLLLVSQTTLTLPIHSTLKHQLVELIHVILVRLHKLVNLLSLPTSGDRLRHLHEATKSSWVCSCSLRSRS